MRENERTVALNIALTPKFVVSAIALLLGLVLGGLFVASQGSAAAVTPANPESPEQFGIRKFYLDDTRVVGAGARFICADGYHFASIWEIADVSNLQYDLRAESVQAVDGAEGPPVAQGWIRTGGDSGDVSETPGMANCNLWETNAAGSFGTVVSLPVDWSASTTDISVWDAATASCDTRMPVWCVED